jgi:hypothetical protein
MIYIMFCNVVKLRKCIHANPLTPETGEPLPKNTKYNHSGKVVLFAAWMLLRFGGWEVAKRKKNRLTA